MPIPLLNPPRHLVSSPVTSDWATPAPFQITQQIPCKTSSREANSRSVNQERSASYGTTRFITVFTTALNCSIMRHVYSVKNPYPISFRSTLILSSHLSLGLQSGLLHSHFPSKSLYAFLIVHHLIAVVKSDEEHKLFNKGSSDHGANTTF
jgi:hypothetical protein